MEKILYPLKNMWITCVPGQNMHKYCQAIDDQGLNYQTIDKLYAPFTGKIIRKYPSECEVWFESVDKVEFADGTIDYATILMAHKDTYDDLKENYVYKQGEVIYSEGTRYLDKVGGAERHAHFEMCAGKTTGSGWKKSPDGTWNLVNGKAPQNCYFVDETINVIRNGGLNFKKISSVTPVVERNESVNQIKVIVSQLRVRVGHSVNDSIVGFASENGIYNDLETYKDDTYTWHKIAENQWVADNGEWLELLPIKDYKTLYENEVKINNELKITNESMTNKINELQESINNLQLKMKEINRLSQ